MFKKYLYWNIILLYFLTGCAFNNYSGLPPGIHSPKESSNQTYQYLKAEKKILALLTYWEKSIEWRKEANTYYHEISEFFNTHDDRLSSLNTRKLHDSFAYYILQVRKPVINLINPDFLKFDYDQINITPEKVSDLHNDPIQINPNDPFGEAFLRNFEIAFAGSLILIDNYILSLDPYLKKQVMRRSLFFDFPDSQKKISKSIQQIWNNYNGTFKYSNRLIQAFKFYKKTEPFRYKNNRSKPYPTELNHLINESFTFKELSRNLEEKNLISRLINRFQWFIKQNNDNIFLTNNHTTHALSMVFGNSIGVIQTRKGKLWDLPKQELKTLQKEMRPLDILLEKTPFRLTDRFIPGHYGHVAIWVGTEKELKELGVWEKLPHYYNLAKIHYAYKGPSFQESIRKGQSIIEALRPGVEINSLRNFLNIDDLAILRPKDCPSGNNSIKFCLTRNNKQKYLLEAFKQIGKDYDFNFDVNTEKKIVCSELAYRTFFNIDFATSKAIGKHSINPDQVALNADENSDPFYPVILYFDGKRFSGDKITLQTKLREILNRKHPLLK